MYAFTHALTHVRTCPENGSYFAWSMCPSFLQASVYDAWHMKAFKNTHTKYMQLSLGATGGPSKIKASVCVCADVPIDVCDGGQTAFT